MTSAALDNLAKIGLLDVVPPSRELMQKMLATASKRLQDAMQTAVSIETRFDCVYTSIRASADAALLAQGYRTSTSKPGHHQTTLQCLVHTMGLPASDVIVLDTLRKQRNLTDYDGEIVTETQLQECLAQARHILQLAQTQLNLDAPIKSEHDLN